MDCFKRINVYITGGNSSQAKDFATKAAEVCMTMKKQMDAKTNQQQHKCELVVEHVNNVGDVKYAC